MKINKTKTLFFFLATQCILGQTKEVKTIRGRILASSGIFTEIEVVNLNSEKSVKVNENGEFNIEAEINDVLFFASKSFEAYRKVIKANDFCEDFISVEMIPKGIELDEVIINQYATINARDLGIISKNQKSYTVAERRLKANSGGLGGLINMLSGRKEMLKKELEVEKKEINLAKLKRLFTSDFYQKSFHIAADKITTFQYYCIENKSFAKLLETNNKAQMLIAMLQLASTFNELNSNEGKL
ncbi:hypothetical protein [Flavobacterium polysaccharolyticum]|uniref:CarboxypepD_reg-like domain-containing protein n=1 Tax=Flavobacterium polysaccharolyticum TaxID=3133148 RepID=A0ABU9NQ40_9FLAO